MKQLYILATLVFTLISTNGFSQTVFIDEDFESIGLPSGWSRQQNTPSRGWEFGTAALLSSDFLVFPDHTRFAASNDDKHDNQAATANIANRDMLITPSFNLSAVSAARLTFSVFHTGAYGSGGFVEISTDGGTNWSVLYTISSSAAWQDLTIDLANYVGQPNVKLAFVHNDGGQWADGVGVDDVKVFAPTPNDVQLLSIDVPATAPVGSIPIAITVQNFGTSILNSFTFDWSIDNGVTRKTDVITGLGLAPGANATITHNFPVTSLTAESFTVNVYTSLPNGQADPTANNNGTKSFDVLLGTADRVVLIEQHTGAWCQFCPDGTVRLNAILAANSDVTSIGIHDSDAMSFADGNTVATFADGYPSGTIDRVLFPTESSVGVSRGQWNTYAQLRKTVAPKVFIEADNIYDPTTRLLTVNVSAQFLSSLVGDYRLNVFIAEDSVKGTGNGYNQQNAYNNAAGHPYQGAGNPILGYPHRNVARHFMGGAWGLDNIIPDTTVALTPYTHTFTYTLPAGWNADLIDLVVVVQEYSNSISKREILNSLPLALNEAGENGHELLEVNAAIELVTIYHSECGGGKEGEILVAAMGCTDCTFAWSSGQTGDFIFGLSPGVYTVTMTNNSGVSVENSYTVYGALMLNANVVINNGTGNVSVSPTGGTPPYTISWSNGETSTSLSGLALGNYDVTITDAAGCTSEQSLRVNYPGPVGTSNLAQSIDFNVYPNPTAGLVNIEADLGLNTNITIQVFNTIGALVNERTLNGQAQVREVIDLGAQANGIYIVKVTADGTTAVKRLVLNR